MKSLTALSLAVLLAGASLQPTFADDANVSTSQGTGDMVIDRTVTGSTPTERQPIPGAVIQSADPAAPAPSHRYPSAPTSMGGGVWL